MLFIIIYFCLLRGHAGQGLLHQKCQEFLHSLFPSSNHRRVNTYKYIHIFIEQWRHNWASRSESTYSYKRHDFSILSYIFTLILYPCRTLCPDVIRTSLSPIFQYFSCYTIVITKSPVRAPAMCHGFRQPWILIRQPVKRHFTREEKGIETIATVTVLKKERPDSLAADIIKYQKCKILIVML